MTEPTGKRVGAAERLGKRARRYVPLWGILFIVGLGCLFMAEANLSQSPETQLFQGQYTAPADSSSQAMFGLGALIFLSSGGLGLWLTLYNGFIRTPEWFDFYDDGFIYHRKTGSNEEKIGYLWSELQSYTHSVTRVYRNGIYTGDRRLLKWQTTDGRLFAIDNSFTGTAQLVNPLLQMTFAPILDRAIQQINLGQSIQFGKISVTPNGLYNGQKTLTWDDVADVSVVKGTITITERDPNTQRTRRFATLKFGTLPNAHVFVSLVNGLRQRK